MILLVTVLAVSGLVLGALAAVGWVVSVADSAPNIAQLHPRDQGQISEVFTADGQPLGYLKSTVLRTVVPSGQIPHALKEATVAIEDRRFYQHGGVDYYAILRAGLRDLFNGAGSIQGGSTLTMQLVRNTYLPERYLRHRDLKYKIIEAKLAEQLEKKHSREWILDNYLNDVPYGTVGGQNAYGVGAASQLFFNKPVSQLDLAQIALLAGLPQAPTSYNPFLHKGLARARRREVLQAMVTSGYITQAQADAAAAQPLQVHKNDHYTQRQEPYVLDYVQQTLDHQLGKKTVDQGGLKIYTTINPAYQEEARAAILGELSQPGDPAAAVVTVNPVNGNILAMANSTTYQQSQFDYATQANRQTGSAFKVFALMTLIHDYQGNPNDTYYDSKQLFPGWLPGYPTYGVETAEHSYQGVINITKATVLSDNTVFAQLAADIGFKKLDAMAHAMGITSPLQGNPSEVIGGLRTGVSALQMADAYATVANGGYHYPPTVISKVILPSGKVVDLGSPQPTQVFTTAEAYAAIQILKGVITSGTGTAANYGCPAAGKTGTTSNYTDAWFVGFTPRLSTAVWVGYPTETTSMNDVNGLGPGFGGTLAAPIWHTYMREASAGYCGDFTPPPSQFAGKPFYGASYHYAIGGGYQNQSQYQYGTSGGAVTPTVPITTPTPVPTTGQYTNPQLYNPTPQPAPTTGTGNGVGNGTGTGNGTVPPTGAGTGNPTTPGSGGAGAGH
ncbi:MAG TPA: transglycosylase domain-containing protein [Solirubrobacteraceae bacterium]|nr:transglycosylase domain-containing protein [Solirubrobacteraceae bacterium]